MEFLKWLIVVGPAALLRAVVGILVVLATVGVLQPAAVEQCLVALGLKP